MNKEDRLYDFSVLTQHHPPDNEFIRTMLLLFLDNMPVTNDNLVKACQEQNWEEVHFNAHKMKAGIDSFNVTPLKSVIRKVEKETRQIHPTDIAALNNDVQLIDHYIKKCVESMKQEIQTL